VWRGQSVQHLVRAQVIDGNAFYRHNRVLRGCSVRMHSVGLSTSTPQTLDASRGPRVSCANAVGEEVSGQQSPSERGNTTQVDPQAQHITVTNCKAYTRLQHFVGRALKISMIE
jgi:hypothetical protein